MRLPILTLLFFLSFFGCTSNSPTSSPTITPGELSILRLADQYLRQIPTPITDFVSPRSAGGVRDFYSEGDYWWPDPDHPDGPYIRRDGQSNPDNFVAHRKAMFNLSRWVATLVTAYQISGEGKYAEHAIRHLKAWFIDPDTSMTPHLLYGQAIKGRVTGRGIGIIDTIHLIEVARAIEALRERGALTTELQSGLADWFGEYLTWITTHSYGIDERNNGNNHSTWWAAQVAAFARLTGRQAELELARRDYKTLLDDQLGEKGTFPKELSRTKPYIYTLFNLEGFSVLAHLASTPDTSLWRYQNQHGSLLTAWKFITPHMLNKADWPYPPDVMYYDQVPIRSPGMLMAASAYADEEMFSIWSQLSPERASAEIDRNFPLRQSALWVDD